MDELLETKLLFKLLKPLIKLLFRLENPLIILSWIDELELIKCVSSVFKFNILCVDVFCIVSIEIKLTAFVFKAFVVVFKVTGFDTEITTSFLIFI